LAHLPFRHGLVGPSRKSFGSQAGPLPLAHCCQFGAVATSQNRLHGNHQNAAKTTASFATLLVRHAAMGQLAVAQRLPNCFGTLNCAMWHKTATGMVTALQGFDCNSQCIAKLFLFK